MNIHALGASRKVGHLKYVTSEVTCLFHDSLSDRRFRIIVNCPKMRACFYSDMGGFLSTSNCHLEETKTLLKVNSKGRFIIGPDMNPMEPTTDGSLIALGLSADSYPYLFSIRAPKIGGIFSGVFLAVAIQSTEDVNLVEISEEDWLEEDRSLSELLKKKNIE